MLREQQDLMRHAGIRHPANGQKWPNVPVGNPADYQAAVRFFLSCFMCVRLHVLLE